MHKLKDLRGTILAFILLTHWKVNDANVLDKVPVEVVSFYLMDTGYDAFEKFLKNFHMKRTYFVTRIKDSIAYNAIETIDVDKGSGILSDKTSMYTGY